MPNDDKSTPWWHSSGAFAAVTTALLAVLGGIVSATSFAVGHLEKNREIQLEREKQLHELRLAYLDRLEKPLLRKQVLEFITMNDYDPALEAWAKQELVVVSKEVAALEKDVDSAQQGERQQQARVEKLDAEVHAVGSYAATPANPTAADPPPKPPRGKNQKDVKEGGKSGKDGKSAGPDGQGDGRQPTKLEDELTHARSDLERRRAAVDAKRTALGISPIYQQAPAPNQPPPASLLRPRRASAE